MYRHIISTMDGEIWKQRDIMKIRQIIWDFKFTKIRKIHGI